MGPHPPATSAFALPDRLSRKADPRLVADDERHLARVADSLETTVAELAARLRAALRAPGGAGQAALERDQEVHRTAARLRTLSRYGMDLCLGRMVPADGSGPVYVGRLGLSDRTGGRLLVDWRSPAAEPFFGATHADPMGLTSRRRYRWAGGRVSDYWDEVFDPDGTEGHAALDDRSAFVASLGSSRSTRMRDVLGTIQADQDAVIRAGSRGALVVDGGPGTGKTVVALHRSAYLLYANPGVPGGRGGVLFVGPHEPFLDYVSDVLPGLGEDGVRTCTLRHLVREGAAAAPEPDPRVARLKSSLAMVRGIEAAVALYEEPPTTTSTVATPWGAVRLAPEDWERAFDAPDPGTPHNEGRDQVWEELVTVVAEQLSPDLPRAALRRSLAQEGSLRRTFTRAWPLLEAADVVGDLWTVPAYLRRCAPWLDPDEVRALQREAPDAWTLPDLPLLDAARRRLGDPDEPRRRRRREAAVAADQAQMDRVVDTLVEADDGEGLVSMLRHQDLQFVLVDEAVPGAGEADVLGGPFSHVVVDEAQELTDAEWTMVLARCPSRSLTVVGDRAQARRGFPETWPERLARVGVGRVEVATLGISYRTPTEVMAAAEPVVRAVLPDANVPVAVRSSGLPVLHGRTTDLPQVLSSWLAEHDEGVACVIGGPDGPVPPRVRRLTPELAKGLEFDLVVLVDPQSWGDGVTGAVDRYVAMTRATQQLVVLAPG